MMFIVSLLVCFSRFMTPLENQTSAHFLTRCHVSFRSSKTSGIFVFSGKSSGYSRKKSRKNLLFSLFFPVKVPAIAGSITGTFAWKYLPDKSL